VTVLLTWAWRISLGHPLLSQSAAFLPAVLIGAALAVIPASSTEAALAGTAADPTVVKGRRNLRRPVRVVVVLVLLLVALTLIPRAVAPTWRDLQARGAVDAAGAWLQQNWNRVEGIANQAVDMLYLRYYDRRAPTEAAAAPSPPAASASPAVTPGGQQTE
jgi:hypothetical protein